MYHKFSSKTLIKIITFFLWIVIGLVTLSNDNVTKLDYGICWILLLIELFFNAIESFVRDNDKYQ